METKRFLPGFWSLCVIVLIAFSSCSNKVENNRLPGEHVLWYEQPAQKWEEALPLGNGRLGVMVFGNPSEERIQLNDDSMWPADKGWDEPAGNENDLEQIRELLKVGKHVEADALFVEKFSRKRVVRSHQTLGDLHLGFQHENITDYRRDLDLQTATATVSYRTDGQLVTEKIFVSHPHRAIVIELATEAADGLNGKVSLSRPMDGGKPTVVTKTTADNLLLMQGEVTQRDAVFDSKPDPIEHGVQFETCLKIDPKDGTVVRGDDFLELQGVKKATLYLVSNSSFYFDDYAGQNEKDLKAVSEVPLAKVYANHVQDFQKLYNRVSLAINDQQLDSIPTDKRLQQVKEGQTDTGLESLLFQYGRYLLISSSRVGTNPANLQGLWNQHITAPWNADYHLNINLQMNYWLADVTNLSELNTPLFDYLDRVVENGKVTARKNFGCKGSFFPHATDLWAPTWMRAPTAYWGCSVGAGGWMMQHYWQHFEFTRDTDFLEERAFPAIEQVAQFYSDWIVEDERDGMLVSSPSTSPENRFYTADGKPVASCMGSAMDQQIIAEVFDNYIHGAEILNQDSKLLKRIKQQRAQLRPGFVLGSDGRILEWDREYKEVEPGHRHMSHLYGFHPGTSVTKTGSPEIFEAVRKTLDYRLANGGAGTGWSRAWLINCSARLLDGDMAQEHIQLLLQKSMYDNLFDGHPPFQIDGNFGYTAGVAEMLLQSHENGLLRILSALPSNWKKGQITGLKARGGFVVDIYWADNRLEKAVVKATIDQTAEIGYQNQVVPLALKAGESFVFQPK